MFGFFGRRNQMIPTSGAWCAVLVRADDGGPPRLWRQPVVAWMQADDSLVGVILDGETLAPHAVDHVNGDPVTLLGYAPLDQVAHLPEYVMDFESEAQLWADIVAELKVKPHPRAVVPVAA